jgi:DNA polymerase-3 subunit delta'
LTHEPAPPTFNDFLGNPHAVEGLRTAIAAGRLPHSLILAGPQGAGKYTLSLMLAMAVQCERQPRELWSTGQSLASFCGVCSNCTRIASAADLQALVDTAVSAHDELRETDKKETRILIQQHPDVLIVPPDPPQLLIKLGQVRSVLHASQYLPSEAPRKLFIFSATSFMKEAANSLLKLLEEPPDFVHLILCAENPGELLPTIRSRCALVRLGALQTEELEMMLADRRPEWQVKHRALVARLAQGAAGKALSFDLEGFTAARADGGWPITSGGALPMERVPHSSQSHRDEWVFGPASHPPSATNPTAEASMHNPTEHTQTLAAFRENPTELLHQLKTTYHPHRRSRR